MPVKTYSKEKLYMHLNFHHSSFQQHTLIFVSFCALKIKEQRYARSIHCHNGACGGTVPGSIPGGVTGFFSDISPSNCTMAMESSQPLVKMSTRYIPGGKGGRCVRITPSPPLCAKCHEIWEPKPPGTLWATPGLLWDSLLP